MPPMLFSSQFCSFAPGGSWQKVPSHLHYACSFNASEQLSFILPYTQLSSELPIPANHIASLFLCQLAPWSACPCSKSETCVAFVHQSVALSLLALCEEQIHHRPTLQVWQQYLCTRVQASKKTRGQQCMWK